MPIDTILRGNRKTGAELRLAASHKALSDKRRAPEEIFAEKRSELQKKTADKVEEDGRRQQLQQLLTEFQDTSAARDQYGRKSKQKLDDSIAFQEPSGKGEHQAKPQKGKRKGQLLNEESDEEEPSYTDHNRADEELEIDDGTIAIDDGTGYDYDIGGHNNFDGDCELKQYKSGMEETREVYEHRHSSRLEEEPDELEIEIPAPPRRRLQTSDRHSLLTLLRNRRYASLGRTGRSGRKCQRSNVADGIDAKRPKNAITPGGLKVKWAKFTHIGTRKISRNKKQSSQALAVPFRVTPRQPSRKRRQTHETPVSAGSDGEDNRVRLGGISDVDEAGGNGAQPCAAVMDDTGSPGAVNAGRPYTMLRINDGAEKTSKNPRRGRKSAKSGSGLASQEQDGKIIQAKIRVAHLPQGYKHAFASDFSYFLIQHAGISEAWTPIQEDKPREFWKIATGVELEKGSRLMSIISKLADDKVTQWRSQFAKRALKAVEQEFKRVARRNKVDALDSSAKAKLVGKLLGDSDHDRPFYYRQYWDESEVDEEKRTVVVRKGCMESPLVISVYTHHQAWLEAVPHQHKTTSPPIGAMVLMTQALLRALKMFSTGAYVLPEGTIGMLSRSNWDDCHSIDHTGLP